MVGAAHPRHGTRMSALPLHRPRETHPLRAPEPAGAADLDQVSALLAQLFPADPTTPPAQELKALVARRDPYLSVVRAGPQVAGVALLRDQPWRPWTNLAFLGVARGFRGCGIGGALTRHALETAQRPILRLIVREANRVALHVYREQGMVVCGRRTGGRDDALVMMRWTDRQRRAAGLKPAAASLR